MIYAVFFAVGGLIVWLFSIAVGQGWTGGASPTFAAVICRMAAALHGNEREKWLAEYESQIKNLDPERDVVYDPFWASLGFLVGAVRMWAASLPGRLASTCSAAAAHAAALPTAMVAGVKRVLAWQDLLVRRLNDALARYEDRPALMLAIMAAIATPPLLAAYLYRDTIVHDFKAMGPVQWVVFGASMTLFAALMVRAEIRKSEARKATRRTAGDD